METKLLKATNEAIDLACELLKKGEVVGVPTETVYGLAGDSTNNEAIQKIFDAKGRPSDNPLIVHISNLEMLDGIVSAVNADAKTLAENFWPGPLTIIMPKGHKVCEKQLLVLTVLVLECHQMKLLEKLLSSLEFHFQLQVPTQVESQAQQQQMTFLKI